MEQLFQPILKKRKPCVLVEDDKLSDVVKNKMCPALFTIARNNESCYCEDGFLATLRYSVVGSRRITIAPNIDILKFFVTKRPKLVPTLDNVQKYFNSMDDSDMQALVTYSSKVLRTSVEPADMVYVPACYMISETTEKMSDFCGIKLPVLVKNHRGAFEEQQQLLTVHAKRSEILDLIIDSCINQGDTVVA